MGACALVAATLGVAQVAPVNEERRVVGDEGWGRPPPPPSKRRQQREREGREHYDSGKPLGKRARRRLRGKAKA